MPLYPSQIGPYRIIRQIGSGGMGIVLEGVHTAIERRVAIKLLLPEHARDAAVTDRLLREALVVNRINHPGLVQVSDCGRLPDSTVYLVMEYLRGQTLARWLERNPGPVSPPLVLSFAVQIASGLAAAHRIGVVHRDLKPDNLMLVPEDRNTREGGAAVDSQSDPRELQVKILDFGIAKIAQEGTPSKSKTATDLVMGTPYYMSPEQCQGAGYVDEKSDVYSFGVLLFELLAGRRPFEGEGSGQLIGMHLFKAPPLLRSVAPSAPPGLADLVQALLAKQRDARPTMEELCVEFERMLSTGSIEPSAAFLSRLAVQRSNPSEGVEVTTASPATAAPNRSAATTLDSSGGQSLIGRRSVRSPWLAVGAIAALLSLTIIGVVTQRSPNRPAASSASLVAPLHASDSANLARTGGASDTVRQQRRIRWSITTQPRGAVVLRASSGEPLGKTPFEGSPPAGSGELRLLLRLNGYQDEPLTLEHETSAHIERTLRLKPAPARPQASPRPTAPAVPSRERRSFPLED